MAEVAADHQDNNVASRAADHDHHYSVQVDEEEQLDRHCQDATDEDEEDDVEEQEGQEEHQPRHRRKPVISRIESNNSRPREATELDEIGNLSSASTSVASISSGEYRVTPRHSNRELAADQTAASSLTTHKKQRFKTIRRWWTRNITLNVPQKGNRDYFALERTFLAYMRTAATFSMQGVLVAQLFRLQTGTTSNTRLNFENVGVPLSVAYQTCAIFVALMGAYRFWRQQHTIARGKVLAGGWELHGIGILTLLAGVTLLALALAIIAEDV